MFLTFASWFTWRSFFQSRHLDMRTYHQTLLRRHQVLQNHHHNTVTELRPGGPAEYLPDWQPRQVAGTPEEVPRPVLGEGEFRLKRDGNRNISAISLYSLRTIMHKIFRINWPMPTKRARSWVRFNTAMALGDLLEGDGIRREGKLHKQPQFYWCGVFACPVPQNDPKCLRGIDSRPVSHSLVFDQSSCPKTAPHSISNRYWVSGYQSHKTAPLYKFILDLKTALCRPLLATIWPY